MQSAAERSERFMLRRALLFVNPLSGKGKSKKCLLDIIRVFTEAGYSVRVYPTTPSREANIRFVQKNAKYNSLIVAIGGDGTFRGAVDLTDAGIPCIGIPGTIDNDIASTDMTIGFDTAMNTVVELVDKLRDTGESHARCNVVEVMGREAGDIALNTSIAVGAVTAVIKEIPTDFEYLFHKMAEARQNGKRNFIIITCEGMGPGYSEQLCKTIEEKTGIETRLARLAHVQRGGSPTLRDRVLATQMGCAAVESLVAGQMKRVVCLRDNSIITMDIHEALLLDKMMKNTLTPEEREQIAPNALFDMTTRIAEMQAYKQYLNYIIDHMAL